MFPRPTTSRSAPPVRGRSPRRRGARPALEELENRCLLSAGALDPLFNGTGKELLDIEGDAHAVAVQRGGKIVVAGFTVVGANMEMAVARLNADGTLDPNFNGTGKQAIDFGGPFSAAYALAVQPDGKIVLAGSAGGPGGLPSDFAVARLNPDGTLDTTFGNSGKQTITFGGPFQAAYAVALQPDGDIILAGSNEPGEGHVSVARLTPAGALDTSFNRTGKVTFDYGGLDGSASAIALQPDGRIVLAGQAIRPGTASVSFASYFGLARLNPDGTPDATFGNLGTQTISFGGTPEWASALALQPDGKIVVAGQTSPGGGPGKLAVARLTPVGALDTSFSGSGQETIDFGGIYSSASAVALQPDGKIVLAGEAQIAETTDMAVARLTADGALDADFNGNGKQTVSFGDNKYNRAAAVAIQPNGKIVLAGSSGGPSSPVNRFAVARLQGDVYSSTAAAFDSGSGTWYLRNANSPGAPSVSPFAYGAPGWVPVAGDWDGNRIATIGVVDPGSATWYLRNSNSPGLPDVGTPYPSQASARPTTSILPPPLLIGQGGPFRYGLPGWVPVVGDWTGSGHTGIGMFDPATGTWYLRNELSAGPPNDGVFQYGGSGWVPVVGDWDGDGVTTVGVVDPATMTWYLRNSNTPGAPDVTPFQYGGRGWKPVVGDWNADGVTSAGVLDPGGVWYLRDRNGAGLPDHAPFPYGLGGWVPLAGTWAFSAAAPVAAGRARVAGPAPSVLGQQGFDAGGLDGATSEQVYPGANGAGLGASAAAPRWYTGPAARTDSAFTAASPGRPLTAVAQETGPLAGLPDRAAPAAAPDLTTDALAIGTRRTEALDAVFARGL